ncbi:carbohydrate kinase family protein [Actinoalloteichus caeruleus]|uniref:Sugar or nucleoside kinase, ribokinase family n=1 Tax=Actinoalloteichus caeruleus DSM 43889 TaxID=1120930 RepID=A0ABT1JH10_ACTCY|nr:PfkB family carbohydrate kinase [Actinoalloteichus caeruleus]MCP2331763.1 Sugar or nucleoside kinase, ribokinase family [Actinoalloteichus caeruleus DSM 43889]
MMGTAPPGNGTPTVVVVGDAGLDVVARHRDPLVTGGDTRARIRMTAGGAGANTAAWLAREGVHPVLVARVGDDAAGRQTETELEAAGVRCAFAVDPDEPTCCVIVLVDGTGQRTMVPDRGANARFSPSDVDPAVIDGTALAGTPGWSAPRHLHLSGYVLLDASSRDAGLAALRGARAAGLTTSVDPQAAVLLTREGSEDFLEAVRGVDLLLPNQDELLALTGSADPSSAEGLLDLVGAVAVTGGAEGAWWVDRDGVRGVPAPRVECADSTGAGDAFDAGVVAAWLRGASAREALAAGVLAGTEAVRHVGAQPPSATPPVIRSLPEAVGSA